MFFFRAPQGDVKLCLAEMAKQRKIPPHPRGKSYRCFDLLGVGAQVRVLGFASEAEAKGVRPNYLANITQDPSYAKSFTYLCPALMRRSVLWGAAHDRVLIPREHLGAQGWILVCHFCLHFQNT